MINHLNISEAYWKLAYNQVVEHKIPVFALKSALMCYLICAEVVPFG
jgi:hypothetical protein